MAVAVFSDADASEAFLVKLLIAISVAVRLPPEAASSNRVAPNAIICFSLNFMASKGRLFVCDCSMPAVAPAGSEIKALEPILSSPPSKFSSAQSGSTPVTKNVGLSCNVNSFFVVCGVSVVR